MTGERRTSLRIGLNLVFLTPGEQGGMETYARELIPQLVAAEPGHEFVSFVSRDGAVVSAPWNELTETVVVPVSSRNRLQWARGEQQLLPPLARRAGIDLVHSFASTGPAWGRFRRVVTVHDLIYRTVPETHPGLRSLGMRVLVPLAAHRSDRVIADSQSTADDLRRYERVPASRIDVVPLGLGARRGAALPAHEIRELLDAADRPIVLSASAKLPHKNLGRLIGALAEIPAATRPLLVLPGYRTQHESELRSRAGELGVGGDVRFLGWVSAEQLEGLYATATCVVFPTLAEGFGLPVLEAMARGVPVACSDIPVLREVAGDGALFFDPRSESSIAAAMMRLLTDPALSASLAEGGSRRAGAFSWERAAQGTLASYRRALAGS